MHNTLLSKVAEFPTSFKAKYLVKELHCLINSDAQEATQLCVLENDPTSDSLR